MQLWAALGKNPLDYANRFRILEDRGERPALFTEIPGVSTEYVVLVEPRNAVIAMGPSPLPGFGTFLRPFLIAGPVVVAGLALALISAIQQSRRRTPRAESTLPPRPPAGAPAPGGDR